MSIDGRIKTTQHTNFLLLSLVVTAFVRCSRHPTSPQEEILSKRDEIFQPGQYPEAEIQFTKAIHVDPGFAEAHYQLAQTYLKPAADAGVRGALPYRRASAGEHRPRVTFAVPVAGRQFKEAREKAEPYCRSGRTIRKVRRRSSSLLAAETPSERHRRNAEDNFHCSPRADWNRVGTRRCSDRSEADGLEHAAVKTENNRRDSGAEVQSDGTGPCRAETDYKYAGRFPPRAGHDGPNVITVRSKPIELSEPRPGLVSQKGRRPGGVSLPSRKPRQPPNGVSG